MNHRYILAFLLCFLSVTTFAQVTITVPTTGDTVVCNGEPVTLHAVTNGYHSHTVSLSVDDDYSALEPIGFSFDFYGNTYTNMVISSNGFVSFNASDAGGSSNWSISSGIPGNPDCKNAVMGSFSDIYIPAGGTVTYGVAGVAPYRKCVINFCNCHMFSCTTLLCSFQVILYETTNIAEVHMHHKDLCTSWNSGAGIEGVQNATATAATIAPGRNYPGTWTVTVPDGRRFTPNATYTAYTCDTIPFSPIPDSNATLYWYAGTAYEGMGTSITVDPTVPTTYEVRAVGCSDTSRAYASITIGSGPSISGFTTIDPSVCGFCDGTVTLYGIIPSTSDTLNYFFNGVAQPTVITAVGPDSTITITGLCAGTYTDFTVKQGYCVSAPAGPATLNNPPVVITGETSTQPTICGACDGTITLYGLYPGSSDTINYTLGGVPQSPTIGVVNADGTLMLTGLTAGTYSNITATMNVCTSAEVGPIQLINPDFAILNTSSTNADCAVPDGTITLYGMPPGQSITINYNNLYTPQPPLYLTSTTAGTVTISNLDTGSYNSITAILNSCQGCTASIPDVFHITEPAFLPLSLISSSNPTECGKCDGTIVINGLPPYTVDSFFYSGLPPVLVSPDASGNITLANLCEGTYDDFYAKVGICPTQEIFTPVALLAPPMTGGYDTSIHLGCHGDEVDFTNTSAPPANLHYTWNFDDGTSDTATNPVHIYQQGVYTPTLTVTNGYCVVVDTAITLSLLHPLHAAFTTTDTVCQGTPVAFIDSSAGTAPITYEWNFGDSTTDTATNPTHIFAYSGQYNVTLIATNFIPCSDTAYTTVFVDSLSAISLSQSDATICSGTSVQFGGVYSYIGSTGITWNFGNGDSISNINPITYSYTSPGSFTVTLNAKYRACPTVSASTAITVFAAPSINLGPDTALCPGSTAIALVDNINSGNAAATWSWTNGETTPAIEVINPGTYAATVAINGCFATDSVTVLNDCYMDMPNVFSPNGDGINDYFYPRQFLTKGVVSFNMQIFSRWGQKVFEGSTVDGRGWDGKFNGVDQPEGVYIYNIDATFVDGQKEHHQGNVTLLK